MQPYVFKTRQHCYIFEEGGFFQTLKKNCAKKHLFKIVQILHFLLSLPHCMYINIKRKLVYIHMLELLLCFLGRKLHIKNAKAN